MSAKTNFFDSLQALTERYLTHRRYNRRLKREKQKAKNPIVDWIEAFLWAAGVVLLVNQYLFQAYQIPSESMVHTLLIGDRIFVNKLEFGPELVPGMAKLPSPFKPQRNQVIIFENPSYISRGPAFDIAQRVIYMLTLSLVDIDRDENGAPKPHFLIKRAIGMGGDILKMEKGEMSYLFPGETELVTERDYLRLSGLSHPINRLMKMEEYPVLEAAGREAAYADLGLALPTANASGQASSMRYPDYIAHEKARLEVRGQPTQRILGMRAFLRLSLGWYVSEGRIFPLGDNRDNSRDARYFGAVKETKVLGHASLMYWPPKRMGFIR
ncbi:signal peptidase I [Treponema sp.]